MGILALGKRVITSYLDSVDSLKGINRTANLAYLVSQTLQMVGLQRIAAYLPAARLTHLTFIVNTFYMGHWLCQFIRHQISNPPPQSDDLLTKIQKFAVPI